MENCFWLKGFNGEIRWVVNLLIFGWLGVVGYRLVCFLGARGVFRERGKTEDGGRRKGRQQVCD